MSYYNLIRKALLERTSCFCVYDGHPRYFCPHVIGWKADSEQTLVWQYRGSSSTGPIQGQWKCLKIEKMTDLSTIDELWVPGEPGSTGARTRCVDEIDVEIDLSSS